MEYFKREWQTGHIKKTDCTWFVMRCICLIIPNIIGILILIIIVKLCNPGISYLWCTHILRQRYTSYMYIKRSSYIQCTISVHFPTFHLHSSSFSHTHWCLISYAYTPFIHVHCITYWTVLIKQILLWYLMLTLSLNPIITRLHVLQSVSVWLAAIIDHSCIINTLWNANIAFWLFGIS